MCGKRFKPSTLNPVMVGPEFYGERYVEWALSVYATRGSSERKLNAIEKELNLKPDDILLDLGCGPGVLLKRFAPCVKKIIGIDYAPACITSSKKLLEQERYHNFALHSCDFEKEKLPLMDNSIPKILFVDVIEHLRDEKQVLKEIHRVLKPGGIVIITTLPNKNSVFYLFYELLKRFKIKPQNLMDEADHVKLYSVSSLKKALHKAQLTPIKTQTYRILAPLFELLKCEDNDYLDFSLLTKTPLGNLLASGILIVAKK